MERKRRSEQSWTISGEQGTDLVHSQRADFKILFPDEYFDGTFVRQVVLQQVLAVSALEPSTKIAINIRSIMCSFAQGKLTPTRDHSTDNAT